MAWGKWFKMLQVILWRRKLLSEWTTIIQGVKYMMAHVILPVSSIAILMVISLHNSNTRFRGQQWITESIRGSDTPSKMLTLHYSQWTHWHLKAFCSCVRIFSSHSTRTTKGMDAHIVVNPSPSTPPPSSQPQSPKMTEEERQLHLSFMREALAMVPSFPSQIIHFSI
jgi:hypothetical protein